MVNKTMTVLTLAQARDALRARDISAQELINEYINSSQTHNSTLNAYITTTYDIAMSAAKISDNKLDTGQGGLLEGIPIANKDMFCTQGVLTTAGSRILDNFIPNYESTVSNNLKNAGAISLGKLNQDEFAMGSANNTSYFGQVINPWKKNSEAINLVPGGSSGGSAVAVAANMVLGATGTDTGGSIRQPASFCGITGLKPTYGRCSRWGIIAFASSLDQAGPLTHDVRSAAIMLEAMAGYDPKDSTSVNLPVPAYEQILKQTLSGKKIGIPVEYMLDDLTDDMQNLMIKSQDWLQQANAEIVSISLPYTKYALSTYYIIGLAECSSNLARYDGIRYGYRSKSSKSLDDMYMMTRAEGFGKEVKRRILLGTYVLSAGYHNAYYLRAQKVRQLITQDFLQAFVQCDVILTPTTPNTAFAVGEKTDDPIDMYLNDVFTVPASLAGLPAISVPSGLSVDGLPLGLQVIGRPFDEESVLQVAYVLEQNAAFSYLTHAS